ncbi:MAG TPA: tyrosinase family protein [Thermoanaerobaculia bacterium]|jgi:tyrosinase
MSFRTWSKALLFAMLPLALVNCATLVRCPGSLLPIVEIQVNNTPSNHDDYGSTTTAIPARARITNTSAPFGGLNFASGVAVEVRNPTLASNLSFSSTAGGAGSPSLVLTLNDAGAWSTFYVRGNSTSTVDKSAIVEMATWGGSCNEVVIGRKALMIPSGAPPIGGGSLPRVEVEIGSIATLDDYVAWSPVGSRIRWTSGSPGATLNVTLRNLPTAPSRLRFAANPLAAGTTATAFTLPLTLNGDGSWVQFHVAGRVASEADKDAVLEVLDAGSGAVLSREGLMVRIRKNANSLLTAERDRYLKALQKVANTYADYIDFVKTHSRGATGTLAGPIAHRQAHNGSAFMPWHRAFVLHLERLLQAADPSVALPYWKFDVPAPNVFTPDFMGANSNSPMATLNTLNPIFGWPLPGEGVSAGIQRRTPYGNNGNPSVPSDVATLGLGTDFASFKAMEGGTHNPAHSTSSFGGGTGSWIGGSAAIATRDPLFFLLHCNVDRLWARWQWINGRHTPTSTLAYDLQGKHGAPAGGVDATRSLGQYADDTMWPWDNVTGGTGTAERPAFSILNPFPITLGGVMPLSQPTVRSLIDYAGIDPALTLSLGFGYDDFNPYIP